MNIHDSLLLSTAFRFSKNEHFTLMPDGFYGADGKRIVASKGYIPVFLQYFKIGDFLCMIPKKWLSIFRHLLKDQFQQLFQIQKQEYISESFPFVEHVELADVLAAIRKFKERKGKSLYENFLEMCVIMLLMESLKNSKIMLGGVWISRSSNHSGKQLNGYEMYVKVLSDKNASIELVKSELVNYPPYSFEEIGFLQVTGPRDNVSPYGRYLENLYLQVFLKNEIQKLYLMTQYITSQEREKQMERVEEIKLNLEKYRDQ